MRMTAKTRWLAIGTMLALAAPIALASAQAIDPAIGTWELNVAKSKYSAGGAPKSQTRTYVATAKGYKFTAKGVGADGKPTSTEFTVGFDGKYVPVTGNPAIDSIMVKRVNASTIKAWQKKGNAMAIRTTRAISKDGKTLTATARGKNAAGKAYTNVEVFDKK